MVPGPASGFGSIRESVSTFARFSSSNFRDRSEAKPLSSPLLPSAGPAPATPFDLGPAPPLKHRDAPDRQRQRCQARLERGLDETSSLSTSLNPVLHRHNSFLERLLHNPFHHSLFTSQLQVPYLALFSGGATKSRPRHGYDGIPSPSGFGSTGSTHHQRL